MIKYTITSHASAYPSMMLAQNGGKHIYSLLMDKDMDNGQVVAKNEWQGHQYYSVKDSTGVEGLILDQAANGNWYIEITNPGDGCFLYNVPMIEEEWTNTFKKESNFYNEKGSKVRGYEMAKGDIVELSALGFVGKPVKGAKVTVEDRKFKVGA